MRETGLGQNTAGKAIPCGVHRRQFLSASFPAVLTAQQRRRPNIVFILLDDLGYGDVGCYGQKKIQTPHTDRLATQGLRFTDAYAGGAVCAPSRCVMMTGLHTGHAAIRANAGTAPILATDRTFVPLLKKAGYATGGFGKWSLGDVGSTGAPERHGFDQFFGYIHQTHAHDYYTDFLWDTNRKFPLPANANGGRKTYSADVIAEKSLDFARRHKDGPFFLYATYTLPHANYEVPSQGAYASQTWPEVEKNFAAMVTRADSMVGNLLGLLKDLGLEENTLVLFSSDNGAPTGDSHSHSFFESTGPLRGHKGQLYEGGIRVPAIVRWPGRIAAGRTSGVPWAFCDFFPTFVSAAGLEIPGGLDGRNLMPLFTGQEKNSPERFLYWEHWGYDFRTSSLRAQTFTEAARWGDWKAIRPKPGAAIELYNLRREIGESNSLATAEPSILAKIEAFMKEAHTPPRSHAGGSRQWVS
ncbi:MAG: arylsulfatase [Acidobacteria bacterium]|nr:arylsulfatase [Acidobacteriota bacterium]